MADVRVSQPLPCAVEAVWALIGDFGGLHRWHPQVSRLDLSWEGRIRTVHFADGAHAVERLEARNDMAHRYTYALVDGPLPMQACHSTLQVRAGAAGCIVVWSSQFEPIGDGEVRAMDALQGMYVSGLEALALAVR